MLLTHIELGMSAVFQVLLYGFAPQSPPWVFISLLVPSERADALSFLGSVWDLRDDLSTSNDPADHALLRAMPFWEWSFVSDVCELLKLAGWKLEGP